MTGIRPPTPLQGRFVGLAPYAPALKSAVRQALDVDPQAWALFSTAGHGEHFEAWWGDDAARDPAKGVSYAVVRRDTGAVVGCTSFITLRPEHRGVEIGATFLHPSVRGGPANPEIKRLMLAHAFDGGLFGEPAVRVEIVTDARNLRSQAAIAKLGAMREGVLRRHKITWTGHVRDTVVYAVTDLDWPAVRERLDARLAAFG